MIFYKCLRIVFSNKNTNILTSVNCVQFPCILRAGAGEVPPVLNSL